jgi:hypothetical protein
MLRRLQRAPTTARALARIVMLAVLAISVFAATVRAGTQYYFCSMMQEQRAEPCCDRQQEQPLLPEVHERPCCQSVTVDSLPSGAATQLPRVSSAPLAAFVALPALAMRAYSRAGWGQRGVAAPRAGPPPPALSLERRTILLI